MRFNGGCFGAIFVPIIGVIFLVVGLGIAIFATRAVIADAERAERLSPRGAAAISDGTVGEEVLFEGQISERNRLRFREFVAYQREEYRGSDEDGDQEWALDETVTPELIVESGRDLALISADYNILGPHSEWQEPGNLRYVGGEGTKRYEGFVVNRPITAIGVIEEGVEGPQLKAEFIFGGTREAYIADRRETARFLPIFGGIFALVGLVTITIGLWPVIRRVLFGR